MPETPPPPPRNRCAMLCEDPLNFPKPGTPSLPCRARHPLLPLGSWELFSRVLNDPLVGLGDMIQPREVGKADSEEGRARPRKGWPCQAHGHDDTKAALALPLNLPLPFPPLPKAYQVPPCQIQAQRLEAGVLKPEFMDQNGVRPPQQGFNPKP